MNTAIQPKHIIKANKKIIINLAKSSKENGGRYQYRDICEMLGIAPTETNCSLLSHTLVRWGIRRRKRFTRSASVPKEEHVRTAPERPLNIPEEIKELKLFAETDKERFLKACRAFADIYFE